MIDVVVAAEHDRAEAVPLGLEQELAVSRQALADLSEHGLDRRIDGKGHDRDVMPTADYRPYRSC